MAAVCLAFFAACTRDYPVGPMARTVRAYPDAQSVVAAGETIEATIKSDGSWVVTAPDWITVTPATGMGDATVKITVAPNTGGERTDKVGFYSATGAVSTTNIDLTSTPRAEIAITQAASEGQGGGGEGQVISIADYIALGENSDAYITDILRESL